MLFVPKNLVSCLQVGLCITLAQAGQEDIGLSNKGSCGFKEERVKPIRSGDFI